MSSEAPLSIKPSSWSWREERDFMEGLVNSRFNFLLVLFSLFLTASASAQSKQTARIVLTVGAITCLLVGYTVFRANVKHAIALRALYHEGAVTPNPTSELQRLAKGPSARWLVGWFVPAVCVIVLGLGAFLTAWFRGEDQPSAAQVALKSQVQALERRVNEFGKMTALLQETNRNLRDAQSTNTGLNIANQKLVSQVKALSERLAEKRSRRVSQ